MVVSSQCEMNSANGGLLLALPPRGLSAAVPEPSQAATRAGGFKDLESPMAAYFGESCRHFEEGCSNPASGKPLDDTSNSFLPSFTAPNADASQCGSAPSQQLVDQSPCEAYFNGGSVSFSLDSSGGLNGGSVSFSLDSSPQESPDAYIAPRVPSHFQLPGAASFPNACFLPLHSCSYPFPLPTLLQSFHLHTQPHPAQKRFGHPSKTASRNRGGAETTRTKAEPLPSCVPIKRGVTAPVIRHSEAVSASTRPKPNSTPGVSVAGHVWSLSQDAIGCREVQDVIERVDGEEACFRLAMELSGHVLEALQCPHANHVVRKFITTMSPPSLQFLIDELVHQGADVVREAARHRYGCRIVEALLKTCAAEQVHQMVQHLLPETADLSVRMYGNFVVQRVLEHGTDGQRCYINQVLQANVASTASNFYGSAVVGAALKHCAHEDRVCLAQAIIEVNGLLCAILRFRHGQGIKEQLLEVLEASDQELAQKELQAPPMKALRSDRTFVEHKAPKVSGALPRAFTEPMSSNQGRWQSCKGTGGA